ncbi:MAG: RNA polymerase sigma factor RpoH [Legionellales bacterium]|nr:RNA polymerase sigma factor RpoH [Legionellales bacterium]|tara:strand:- start:282 stop:1109 length:828 start_codon:yes stop_codon:yes gene_type:complete
MLPINSLDSYIARVEQIPMLSAEQEQALAVQYHEKGDLEAAQKLVLSHLRYVVRIAKGYQGYGLALSDMVQEGAVGLMKAVKQFNPSQGVRLVTFAVYWIKSEIHEFVIRNWRIVKMATTKAQRKCFFNLRSSKNELRCFTEKEIHEVADDLGVKPETVRQMEARFAATDVAFDPIVNDEDDEPKALSPAQVLSIEHADPQSIIEQEQKNNRLAQVKQALDILDARSREILSERSLSEKKTSLKMLAERFGISIERVRQLEQQAISQLKAALNED